MNFMIKCLLIISLFLFPICSFAEQDKENEDSKQNVSVKTIERDNYQIQIKQYDQKYPVIMYVVFKDSVPVLSELNKILKTELLTYVNTENIKDTVIISSWFDDQVSDNFEKIELTKSYGAYVFCIDEKGKQVLTFSDYLKYLKKKKEDEKKLQQGK